MRPLIVDFLQVLITEDFLTNESLAKRLTSVQALTHECANSCLKKKRIRARF